jgi:murein DD-endopeptidase MepM/ murein hydrolase activator NlpD
MSEPVFRAGSSAAADFHTGTEAQANLSALAEGESAHAAGQNDAFSSAQAASSQVSSANSIFLSDGAVASQAHGKSSAAPLRSGTAPLPEGAATAAKGAKDEIPPPTRALSYNALLDRKNGRKGAVRRGHRTMRSVDYGLIAQEDADDTSTTSAQHGLRNAFVYNRKIIEFKVGVTKIGWHTLNFAGKVCQDRVNSGMTDAQRKAAWHTFIGHEAKRTGKGFYRSARDTAFELVQDTHIAANADFSSSMPTKLKDATVTGARVARHVPHFVRTAWHVIRHPLLSIKALASAFVAVVPVFLLLVVMVILLLFLILFSAPATNITTTDNDINDMWLYITKLDTDLESDIRQDAANENADEYGYTLNGADVGYIIVGDDTSSIWPENFSIETDCEAVLAYINVKYEDYTFADVKAELERIHKQLYTYELETNVTYYPPDPKTGQPELYIRKCTVAITAKNLQDCLSAGLTDEQRDSMDTLVNDIGLFTLHEELGSPFPGSDWTALISSRYGWRYHPITDEVKCHEGVDIAMPAGTPVSSVMTGTVTDAQYSDSYGNYVDVTDSSGDVTRYAHMQSLSVSAGQSVTAGTQLGHVGSTGASTGAHLHIEYIRGGINVNPIIYLAAG